MRNTFRSGFAESFSIRQRRESPIQLENLIGFVEAAVRQ